MVVLDKANKLTDSELVSEYLRSQNTHFFTLLYRRYAPKAFAKCYSLLRDQGLARDAVQDIFVKVMLNLARFNEHSTFSTWVYSITYNHCIDIIRKQKKLPLIFTEDIGRISHEKVVEVPDSVLLELKHNQLEKILAQLSTADRAILMMKYDADMSIKEIGDAIGKTESAVKMQIMRAKMKAQAIREAMPDIEETTDWKNHPTAAETAQHESA